MATEGVTVRVEGEDGEHVDFTVRFAAFEYTTEAQSKAAWEKAWQGIGRTGVSVWRHFEPHDPPHEHFIVTVAGERAEDVKATVRRLKAMPGARPYSLPQDLMEALAQRRVKTAIKNVGSPAIDGGRRIGMFGGVSRTPGGRDLYPDGSMTMKDKPWEKG